MKRISVFYIYITLSATICLAQTNKSYPHCDCTETLSESGNYRLKSGGIFFEDGNYVEGKRNGYWITKNSEGNTLIKANYENGSLHGGYDLFHFKGQPKLTAQFKNGLQDGNWIYYNEKGNIIKEGNFSNGKPIGIWRVYDKKGKKLYVEYDFDNKAELLKNPGKKYFNKGGVARDDQSGEWMILYWPDRNIQSQIEPIGGYLLAGDLFLDYLNIPAMFMNTYIHKEYLAKVEVRDGQVRLVNLEEIDKKVRLDKTKPSFPFIVQTNSPNKLHAVKHSSESYQLVKDRIADSINLSGPWITNGYNGEIEIRIPFVINDIRR